MERALFRAKGLPDGARAGAAEAGGAQRRGGFDTGLGPGMGFATGLVEKTGTLGRGVGVRRRFSAGEVATAIDAVVGGGRLVL